MKIQVIKTEDQYEDSLRWVDQLMDKDPNPESEDGEKLNLLVTLIEDYESKKFPRSFPEPVDAILFSMEQNNLKAKDLIPYIGSKSKVSEVLAGKRKLTLSMMRALTEGLGIPADVLLQETPKISSSKNINWSKFPLKEMVKRGYINNPKADGVDITVALENFFKVLGPADTFPVLLRKSNYRNANFIDEYALVAWLSAVTNKSALVGGVGDFKKESINLDFLTKLVQLSRDENGPLMVIDKLKEFGIVVVVEPHFSKTHLDGATIMLDATRPVIGLTLRYDRVDYFWFTLLHELSHIGLHFTVGENYIDYALDDKEVDDDRERGADDLAREALIPESKWHSSPAKILPSAIAAESLANELNIHPAIVAGRMRYEDESYTHLSKMVNNAKVRNLFPNCDWAK